MNFYLLIGLPCSGKTTYAKECFRDAIIIDDPKDYQRDVLDIISRYNGTNKEIVIIDPNLCIREVRLSCIEKLKKIDEKSSFNLLFWENTPDKCLVNMDRRHRAGDTREVKSSILLLSRIYVIDDNYKQFRIKE